MLIVLYWCNTSSPTKGSTQAEGVQKQGTEENISTKMEKQQQTGENFTMRSSDL
jgi:hypothetical protein